MDCPECGYEMKDKSYNYYGIGDWDMDYPASCHEEFYCRECKVKCINGEWELPLPLLPTDKQLKTVMFIKSRIPELYYVDVLTKRQAWNFINTHFDKAKVIKRHVVDLHEDDLFCYCNNDVWCEFY